MDGARQRHGARRRRHRARRAAVAAVALTLAGTLGACGDGHQELTTAEALDKLAGRALDERERAERLDLADLMCGFDDRVLTSIWNRLDARQLEFVDWVVAERCPERLAAYERARPSTGTAPVTTADRDAPTTTIADDVDPALLGSLLADLGSDDADLDGSDDTRSGDTEATTTTTRGRDG